MLSSIPTSTFGCIRGPADVGRYSGCADENETPAAMGPCGRSDKIAVSTQEMGMAPADLGPHAAAKWDALFKFMHESQTTDDQPVDVENKPACLVVYCHWTGAHIKTI